MAAVRRIDVYPFADRPLRDLRVQQAAYLHNYLLELGATTVVEEPRYVDRDYLSEFMAFYGESARGYPNYCRRLHFFAEPFRRSTLRSALGADGRARKRLQRSYLGFVVLRPIPSAPLGRTVLKWYPDRAPWSPRSTRPSREYTSHLCGITLRVVGLAWQQQDTSVGTCATVAIWTCLHSSAFDEQHSIPTTAEITRAGHRTAPLGVRVFPSSGLNLQQFGEAIKKQGLAPIMHGGDKNERFSKSRFAALSASYLRSGYPLILLGHVQHDAGAGGHAVCAVGFRESSAPTGAPGEFHNLDGNLRYLYVHDDNVGPNVRFEIKENAEGQVVLSPSVPERQRKDVTFLPEPVGSLYEFVPSFIVAAGHEDIKTSIDEVQVGGVMAASWLAAAAKVLDDHNLARLTITTSSRLMKYHRYLEEELGCTLGHDPKLLAAARLQLVEGVPSVGLHVGVYRVGNGNVPLLDVLFDTSDGGRNLRPFSHVVFDPVAAMVLHRNQADPSSDTDLGVLVTAYRPEGG